MRSVLITGVCGGIGHALANALSQDDWRVYGTDISERSPGLELKAFWQGDVSEEAFWKDLIVPGLDPTIGLNALVHTAAVQHCSKLTELSVADWDRTLAVNLRAAFLGTRLLVPHMTGRSAAVVNVASVHAVATSAGMSCYAASKGGLLAFTRAAAVELSEQGIRVNALLPGAVDTQMLAAGLERSDDSPENAREALISKTPLRRIAAPSEIAKAIMFLIDDEKSGFMTGQSLVIDGGVLARLASE